MIVVSDHIESVFKCFETTLTTTVLDPGLIEVPEELEWSTVNSMVGDVFEIECKRLVDTLGRLGVPLIGGSMGSCGEDW